MTTRRPLVLVSGATKELPTGDTLPVAISDVTGLGTGVGTLLTTPSSANLAAAITDETGSGALVFATSPALTTPNLGTPSAVTLTNGIGLPISTGVSGLGTGVATLLATPSSANLAAAITDETGSGSLVFATSPTLVTPALGTPSALVLTNATGRASSSQTADKIATSGTAVDISTTAPSAGQVLTATSSTAAGWATPSPSLPKPWNNQSTQSANFTAAVNTAYLVTGTYDITLPSGGVAGDMIAAVQTSGAAGMRIVCPSGVTLGGNAGAHTRTVSGSWQYNQANFTILCTSSNTWQFIVGNTT